jgi:isopenicillin-N epimerase
MLGSMAALFLPDDSAPSSKPGSPFSDLTSRLYERHHFEVPVMAWPAAHKRLLRISAGPYNHLGQYERLAEALSAEL